MKRLFAIAFAFLLVGVAGASWWAAQQLEPVAADEAPEVIFEVRSGEGLGTVSRRLEAEGLVRDARAIEWLGRVSGQAAEIRAGEYALRASQSPAEMLGQIVAGRVATYSTSLPEGWTAAQIAERLATGGFVDEAEFLAVVRDPEVARELGVPADGLEGYLFPETYRMQKDLPAREVARILVEQFMTAWQEVEAGAAERGLSMHEVVTLASVVEKETGAAHERPLIASVFANRIERGMRLESDPTVIYGIDDFDGNLRRVHLEDEGNPYNSYRHAGLPPGPIASPGLDALRAVVSPAESDYLFFVSMNDGTHKFSKTYREHVNAVNQYQRRRRVSKR